MNVIVETRPSLAEDSFDLSLLAVDTITIYEVTFFHVIVLDLISLHSVVGALAEGVLQFAQECGLFPSEK